MEQNEAQVNGMEQEWQSKLKAAQDAIKVLYGTTGSIALLDKKFCKSHKKNGKNIACTFIKNYRLYYEIIFLH